MVLTKKQKLGVMRALAGKSAQEIVMGGLRAGNPDVVKDLRHLEALGKLGSRALGANPYLFYRPAERKSRWSSRLARAVGKGRVASQLKGFYEDPFGKTGKAVIRGVGTLFVDIPSKAVMSTGSGRKWYRGEGRQAGKLKWLSKPIGEVLDISRRYVRDPTWSSDKFRKQLAIRDLEINPPGSGSIQDFIGRTSGITKAELLELQKREGKIARSPRMNLEAPEQKEYKMDESFPELADLGEVAKAEAILQRRKKFVEKQRGLRGRRSTLLGRKGAIL